MKVGDDGAIDDGVDDGAVDDGVADSAVDDGVDVYEAWYIQAELVR